MNNFLSLSVTLFLLFLSGCAVKGEYTCGVPNNGVRCQPMNDTHDQLYDGTLNSLHVEPFPEDSSDEYAEYDSDTFYMNESGSNKRTRDSIPAHLSLPSIATIQSKQAILSQPREMRIWFDRFTDPDGDLHDESFVFIRLDNGHWVIDNKPVLY
jgi:conjugal transfer pilus assembly protein TraV